MAFTNATPFPYSITPLSNITPFTYTDGLTFLEKLEMMREWLNASLVPEFNAGIENAIAEYQAGILNAENSVTETKAGWQALFDEFMVNVAAELQALNDAAVAVLVADEESALNDALETLVNSEITTAFAVGSPHINALDLRYSTKTEVTAAKIVADGIYATKAEAETKEYATLNYATKTENNAKVSKGTNVINVKDYGVIGNGVIDDTDAINAAIVAGAGRTVLFPKGTYMVNAIKNVAQGNQPTGIMVNSAGTTLELEQGAVIQAITNGSTGYAVIQVTAPDCVIRGGTVNGDMIAHGATGGEFGHCIELAGGSHRSAVIGTTVQYAWGDGILVWNRPEDILLLGVVADSNRRQGVSIIDAIRPRVIGCTFKNTGRIKFTAPGAGLDIEPDPGTARDVIDALVSDCIFQNNKGDGFLIVAQGRIASATVTGCLATGNDGFGFRTTRGEVAGSPNISYNSCEAKSNLSSGFSADGAISNTRYKGCNSESNGTHGFVENGTDSTRIVGCTTSKNGASGVYSDSTTTNLSVSGVTATANCVTQPTLANFDISSLGTILTGCYSHAGPGPAYPAFGYAVRAGATNAQVVGCSAMGAYTTRAWSDVPGAYVNPVPGDTSNAARAEFTPPRTLTATGPILVTDSLVVCDITAGGALTSLPDPTTVKGGTRFTVKNVNATSLGVISQGVSKTIDGVAQQNLAQWAKSTYTSDGARWLSI